MLERQKHQQAFYSATPTTQTKQEINRIVRKTKAPTRLLQSSNL
jgi:hypothetical protein